MAINEQLTARLRAAFSGVENVVEKKMFRGIAFMVDDKMCVTVGDNELMCRIDPKEQEELLKLSGCRPMEMKGKPISGYIYVHENLLQTEPDIQHWVEKSLKYTLSVEKKPAKKKK